MFDDLKAALAEFRKQREVKGIPASITEPTTIEALREASKAMIQKRRKPARAGEMR